jgi:hypothetical protein
MYTVLVRFADLQDNGFVYNVGDTYPRKGLEPTADRINELASDRNKRGLPLIKKAVEKTVRTKKK